MNSVKWQQSVRLRILAACAVLSAGPVFAESTETAASETNEIVVIAPRSITADLHENEDKPKQKAVISISIPAQFGDLDLSHPEDAERLMVRIHSVARDACRYLDRLYPLDVDSECEERAVANAMPEAKKAIAAAAL